MESKEGLKWRRPAALEPIETSRRRGKGNEVINKDVGEIAEEEPLSPAVPCAHFQCLHHSHHGVQDPNLP